MFCAVSTSKARDMFKQAECQWPYNKGKGYSLQSIRKVVG